jgi:protein TonB
MRHPRYRGQGVNPETTTQELRLQFLRGWVISFALHGLLLFCFLSLFRQSLMTISQEPFHWEVALVQSRETTDESVPIVDTTSSAVAKQPDRTTTVFHTGRTIRHGIPSAERITPLTPQTGAPVTPKSTPDDSSPVTSRREAATTSIPNESPPTLTQATEPPRQQTETPIGSTTQESPLHQTADTTSSGETIPPTEIAQPSLQSATVSDATVISTTRPDYSWLQQAIFHRLEELKRSSRPSLDDSRPLKVTVKAVVSREGALLGSAVVKSSGLDRIDQEAMVLVQRAFPMQLDHPLDRQQIAMRIPIIYSRE